MQTDNTDTEIVGKCHHLPGCGPRAGGPKIGKRLKNAHRKLKKSGESLKTFARYGYGLRPVTKDKGRWL